MHRAVQAKSWPMQTPCAAHPGTRQVEACSRDKKCDIHRRIADEHNRGIYGKEPQTRTTSQNGSPSDNPPQGCNA